MHSGYMVREGPRPEVVRDTMGHANIDCDPECSRQVAENNTPNGVTSR